MRPTAFAAAAVVFAATLACQPPPGGTPDGGGDAGAKTWTGAIAARIALPAGADLAPFNAAAPGRARPQTPAVAAGKVWVPLTNLGADYKAAGPGHVAVIDPVTNAVTKTISLGAECKNAGWAAAQGNDVFVVCGGTYGDAPDYACQDDGSVVQLDAAGETIVRSVGVGGCPVSAAVHALHVWVGDSNRNLRMFLRTTGAIHNGKNGLSGPLAVCPEAGFTQAGDIFVDADTMYVACSGTNNVVRLEANTAAAQGGPAAAGSGPVALASAGGKLLVLNGLSDSLSLVDLADWPTSTAEAEVVGDIPQDVEARAGFAFVVESGQHTVTMLDPSKAKGEMKLAQVSTANPASPADATNPYGLAMTGDTTAFVTLLLTDEVVRVEFSQQ
jgi:DNA-binding beta-propeller fold protein YncE